MKFICSLLLLVLFVGCTEKAIAPNTSTTKDAEIQRIIKAPVVLGHTPGLAVGVLKNGTMTTYTIGVQNMSTGQPFDEYTIGEIGSITKTMTALVTAELVNQAKLSLSDSANRYLPASLQLPSKDGKLVTVRQLLNHTAGLVANPDDITSNPNKLAQPFNYSESQMADYLKRTPLKTVPGAAWAYSNIGMGLAGIVVRQLTGERITKRYNDRIFKPLGMRSTFSDNAQTPATNVAQGYMGSKPFDFFAMSEVFESAGCVKSNVHDMLLYLRFLTNPPQNALGTAHALTKQCTFTIKQGSQQINPRTYHDLSMGLGWGIILNDKNERIFNHSGGTYGFSSFIAFNEQRQTGVILMANAGFTPELSNTGLEILHVLETY